MNLHKHQAVNTSLEMFLFNNLFGTEKNTVMMDLAEMYDCKMTTFSIFFPLEGVLLLLFSYVTKLHMFIIIIPVGVRSVTLWVQL